MSSNASTTVAITVGAYSATSPDIAYAPSSLSFGDSFSPLTAPPGLKTDLIIEGNYSIEVQQQVQLKLKHQTEDIVYTLPPFLRDSGPLLFVLLGGQVGQYDVILCHSEEGEFPFSTPFAYNMTVTSVSHT